MNKEEIKLLGNITQEIFENQYKSIKGLNNYELRKVIENSNWNFILQIIRHLENEIFILKDKIKTYEEPENLTLMFMYCDEKAKDKIKELKDRIDKAVEYIEKHSNNNVECLYIDEVNELSKILKGDKE